MVRVGQFGRFMLFGVLALYMVLPVLAVVLYSIATRWTAHVLPDGYTLQHWVTAFSSPRLLSVILRTFGLAALVTVIDIILVVPASYWQRVHNPRIRPWIELAAAIPFALPFVVIAFGILQLTGRFVPSLQGTFIVLVLGHAALVFPFMYWAVDGAISASNIRQLHEAAQTCGASTLTILRRVVLPNIGPGMASGAMLAFATSFGEFALVQILVGSRFETISLYSLELLSGTNANFNVLAVITCLTFAVVFVVSAAAVYLNRGRATRLLPGAIERN